VFPFGAVYGEAISNCDEIIIIPRKLYKNYSSGVRISVPDIREIWGKYMRWYAEETWLIAGARTVGHGLLQWLETFVMATGVGRHRLTALY
jgi:hypothetical protein